MTSVIVVPVLAIDGPSGSGKGTVGQLLAQRLGWHFLDSGALYRALAVAADAASVDLGDKPRLAQLAVDMDIRFVPRGGGDVVDVLLNGQEIGDRLRTEESGRRASILAAVPEVRRALLQKQHSFRQMPGLVADGRDMGSTVFPDAILKVFLTASAEVRAERRYKQLKDKGFDVNLRRLLDEIRERDARDAGREASPLKPASDACILDTSQLDISGVVERIYGLLQQRRPG
ncbi:MAG: (d)CMP kinase [Gammaproteobacteria bacterium]|nr:(d)CMP kinase [Gammaproteobacteria bacterium]